MLWHVLVYRAGDSHFSCDLTAFQTTFARGEILLTACVSRQEKDQQGPVLAIQPQQAIGMSPESAKRLAAALAQVVQQYEAQYGEISL